MSIAQGLDVPRLPGAHARRASATTGSSEALCPLERLAAPHVTVLHRRFREGGLCALGHIVIGRAGVHVVGVESCPGEPVQTQVVGGMITPKHTELLVRGRVVNSLVERVSGQAAEVTAALADAGRQEVAVSSALWLAGGSLPAFRTRLWIDDVPVVGAHRLQRSLARRGSLDALARYRIRCLLVGSFPGLA